MRTQDRLTKLLNILSSDYPKAWKLAEECRRDRGTDLPDWPEWCFLPMAGWYAAVCDEMQVPKLSTTHMPEMSQLAALGAWRYTQSIYRINPELFNALIETVPKGALPAELLLRMPEWCVYIETPGLLHDGNDLFGFFAHLEHDANDQRIELRLLLDRANGPLAVPLHIGPWTITEALDRVASESRKNAHLSAVQRDIPQDLPAQQAPDLYPLISLLLYVCSDGVEYRASKTPENPQPKRTRRQDWKLFPAAHPRVWNLGDKIGETLEAAKREAQEERKGPRPHIRRAHWHTFYAGPRDAGVRETRVKWIPPLLIAGGESEDES